MTLHRRLQGEPPIGGRPWIQATVRGLHFAGSSSCRRRLSSIPQRKKVRMPGYGWRIVTFRLLSTKIRNITTADSPSKPPEVITVYRCRQINTHVSAKREHVGHQQGDAQHRIGGNVLRPTKDEVPRVRRKGIERRDCCSLRDRELGRELGFSKQTARDQQRGGRVRDRHVGGREDQYCRPRIPHA